MLCTAEFSLLTLRSTRGGFQSVGHSHHNGFTGTYHLTRMTPRPSLMLRCTRPQHHIMLVITDHMWVRFMRCHVAPLDIINLLAAAAALRSI